VPKALTRVTDSRATHYWDKGKVLSREFAEVLKFEENKPAWDIYLVYSKNAKWGTKAPVPDYWMHQLEGFPKDNFLDGAKLAKELEKQVAINP
jgi:hypothetical protein